MYTVKQWVQSRLIKAAELKDLMDIGIGAGAGWLAGTAASGQMSHRVKVNGQKQWRGAAAKYRTELTNMRPAHDAAKAQHLANPGNPQLKANYMQHAAKAKSLAAKRDWLDTGAAVAPTAGTIAGGLGTYLYKKRKEKQALGAPVRTVQQQHAVQEPNSNNQPTERDIEKEGAALDAALPAGMGALLGYAASKGVNKVTGKFEKIVNSPDGPNIEFKKIKPHYAIIGGALGGMALAHLNNKLKLVKIKDEGFKKVAFPFGLDPVSMMVGSAVNSTVIGTARLGKHLYDLKKERGYIFKKPKEMKKIGKMSALPNLTRANKVPKPLFQTNSPPGKIGKTVGLISPNIDKSPFKIK